MHPRKRLSPYEADRAVRSVLLFGLAPGDAYPAIHVAVDAVGSYPAVSPLPRNPSEDGPEAVCFLWRSCRIAPPGRYPAPCPLESGLSSHLRPGKRPPDPRLIPGTMIRNAWLGNKRGRKDALRIRSAVHVFVSHGFLGAHAFRRFTESIFAVQNAIAVGTG